jgi:hypothetical protein
MRHPIDSPAQQEMEPLNRELMSFDLDAVEIEELERRFEMALAQPASPAACSGCPHLVACGTFCAPPPQADSTTGVI